VDFQKGGMKEDLIEGMASLTGIEEEANLNQDYADKLAEAPHSKQLSVSTRPLVLFSVQIDAPHLS